MAAEKIPPYISLQTYYASEEEAETKNEYHNGRIVAMSGGSQPHVVIIDNLQGETYARIKGGPCRRFGTDMRVYSESCSSVYYPDMSAACETPQFADTHLATLLNPVLIVEVLSVSTEAKDRGEKFECYRAIPSLTTYVLLAQERAFAEVFTRQANGLWQLDTFGGIDAVMPLPAIGCHLRFADIYANVIFPPRLEPRRLEEEGL